VCSFGLSRFFFFFFESQRPIIYSSMDSRIFSCLSSLGHNLSTLLDLIIRDLSRLHLRIRIMNMCRIDMDKCEIVLQKRIATTTVQEARAHKPPNIDF